MIEKSAKIKLLLLVAALAIAAIVLEKTYLTAKSPSGVKVMVYKMELMTSASDTNPQTVFSNSAGSEIDLTNDVMIGQAEIQTGAYKRIRITAANGIKVSIGSADDDPCGTGAIFTDRVLTVAGSGTDPNARVQIGFATYDDGGGTWTGPQVTHILLGPTAIREKRNARIEFRFTTGNSLFCIKDAVEIRAPWAGWITLSSGTQS